MHAALDVNIPSCASAIVTTKEVVEPISALRTLGTSAYTVGPGCDFALPFAQSATTAGSACTIHCPASFVIFATDDAGSLVQGIPIRFGSH